VELVSGKGQIDLKRSVE